MTAAWAASVPVHCAPGGPASGTRTVRGGQAFGAILRHFEPLQMPKIPSMVFDMELDDSIRSPRACDDGSAVDVAEVITAHLQPQTTVHRQLCVDVEVAVRAGANETADIAQALTALGYRTLVRTALGGGHGSECLTNLRHTFLLCSPAVSGTQFSRRGNQFIVDPTFRDHFEIAKPTPRYSAVLSGVPQVFVGTQECLSALVTFLCGEMKIAFAATGTTMPPWRQADSMLSKWLPRRSMDEPTVTFVPPAAAAAVATRVGAPSSGLVFAPEAVGAGATGATAAPMAEWRGWAADIAKEQLSTDAALSSGRQSGLSMRLNNNGNRSNRSSSSGVSSGTQATSVQMPMLLRC